MTLELPADPRRVFRRADPGEHIPLTLVEDGGRPHYVAHRFATPAPPPGWRALYWGQENWDGGPGLRRELRVCDRPAPHDAADLARFTAARDAMIRAEQLAVVLIDRLRPWGAVDPTKIVWMIGAIHRHGGRDPLRPVMTVREEIGDAPLPQQLPDPYGTFGPSGPPEIPEALVGKRLSELPDPFEILAEIRALSIGLDLAGDELTLALLDGSP